MGVYLMRGFAVAGSDAGHRAEAGDASWAFGHPEKVKDFGWRAVHLTAGIAKQIIQAYYGKPQSKAYFDACSDGGREALMEAQRFPEDYDGILAGAPANYWSHLIGAAVAATQSLTADPRAYISDVKLPAIQKASLAACDALDGVKDGIVADPSKCHFDPQVLLCSVEESPDCLTQPQIGALKSLYAGAIDHQGATLFPGLTMGDETGWGIWVVGEGPGASAAALYAQNDFRYIVTGNPKWNALEVDLDDAVRQSAQKTAADLDSNDPDLSRFAARGGKLIIYHGWNDPAISPLNSRRWERKKPIRSRAFIWLPALSTAPAVQAPEALDSWAFLPLRARSSDSSMRLKTGWRKMLPHRTSSQRSTRAVKRAG
jgi:feruloyl esterase